MTSFTSISSGDTATLVRRNPGRRAKRRAAAFNTSSMSNLRLRRSLPEKHDLVGGGRSSFSFIASRSADNIICTAKPTPYARASSYPSTPLKANATWDEFATTSAFHNSGVSSNPAKYSLSSSAHVSDSDSSDSSNSSSRLDKTMMTSSPDGATVKSKVVRRVQFSCKDNVRNDYEVTEDDIKNSWLDIDVSRHIEAINNENRDVVLSFGPARYFTSTQNMDAYRDGKAYMATITQQRLMNEMLRQRTKRIQSVLEEQVRQRSESVSDPEALCAVASGMSKWGVELARSSWWLNKT